MCHFFSCVSAGDGIPLYMDAAQRAGLLENPDHLEPDSHTSIAWVHGYRGREEDELNKYEYNPLTQKFTINQLNTTGDSEQIRAWCIAVDWATIIPELRIAPIVHPFKDVQGCVDEAAINLLREWDSVRVSVGANVLNSVWNSVWDSIGANVLDSVWNSVWDSIGDSVRASVGAGIWDSVRDSVRVSIGDSVWDSVGAGIWDSVRDSVGAYLSSFFQLEKWEHIDHEPGENPFQPGIDLWIRGLVPSFDGTTWRLHAGPSAEIVYEEKKKCADSFHA